MGTSHLHHSHQGKPPRPGHTPPRPSHTPPQPGHIPPRPAAGGPAATSDQNVVPERCDAYRQTFLQMATECKRKEHTGTAQARSGCVPRGKVP
eukprot:1136128-Pelagomonas_calceolata.AAC.1